MVLKEIFEVSKPRIIILLVITAVTSMYAGSKFVGPDLNYIDLMHIIIAGSLASAGSTNWRKFSFGIWVGCKYFGSSLCLPVN